MTTIEPLPPETLLPPEALRWRCDPDELEFETTADLEPTIGVVGQSSAMEALQFGLECDAPGQNVFVRGLTGTGRMTLVGHMLEPFFGVSSPVGVGKAVFQVAGDLLVVGVLD